MPLGFLLPLARLVVPDLGRGHVERRDGGAARRVAELGVAPEIADQNHFVHAAHTVPSKECDTRDARDRVPAFYIVVRTRASSSRLLR